MDSEGKRAASEGRSEASAPGGARISQGELEKNPSTSVGLTYITNGGPTVVSRGNT